MPNTQKPYWVAITLVSVGDKLKNRWVCKQCAKCCTKLLALSDEPKGCED